MFEKNMSSVQGIFKIFEHADNYANTYSETQLHIIFTLYYYKITETRSSSLSAVANTFNKQYS